MPSPNLEVSEKVAKWKVSGTPTPVVLKSEKGQTSSGEVFIQSWDAKGRGRRALKALGALWGVGAFTILFPIIHFILPPLLLIAGPIIASLLSRQSSAVLGGIGKCPNCQADFEIVRSNYLKPHDEWPLRDSCGQCREEVTIEMRS